MKKWLIRNNWMWPFIAWKIFTIKLNYLTLLINVSVDDCFLKQKLRLLFLSASVDQFLFRQPSFVKFWTYNYSLWEALLKESVTRNKPVQKILRHITEKTSLIQESNWLSNAKGLNLGTTTNYCVTRGKW